MTQIFIWPCHPLCTPLHTYNVTEHCYHKKLHKIIVPQANAFHKSMHPPFYMFVSKYESNFLDAVCEHWSNTCIFSSCFFWAQTLCILWPKQACDKNFPAAKIWTHSCKCMSGEKLSITIHQYVLLPSFFFQRMQFPVMHCDNAGLK